MGLWSLRIPLPPSERFWMNNNWILKVLGKLRALNQDAFYPRISLVAQGLFLLILYGSSLQYPIKISLQTCILMKYSGSFAKLIPSFFIRLPKLALFCPRFMLGINTKFRPHASDIIISNFFLCNLPFCQSPCLL